MNNEFKMLFNRNYFHEKNQSSYMPYRIFHDVACPTIDEHRNRIHQSK